MNRFIRYLNQNRVRVVIIILVIAFIIILIQTINHILGQVNNTATPEQENVIEDDSRPSESVISGEEITEEATNNNINIIGQFIEYCNAGDFQSAYALLTDDCKEEVFNSLDAFITNYANVVFNTRKAYQLELWYNNVNTYTYRILYIEDNILQTGTVETSNNIEDYITVEVGIDTTKLNINGFIEKLNVNKTETSNGIEITINTRTRYRSVEEYSITITNTTDKTIALSEGTNANDICLIDNNDTEYDSVLSEVPVYYLELAPGERRTLDIRFYKMYNPYRRIEEMQFKNVILDKELYDTNRNEELIININIDI